jgi:ABC-type nitrate/sulfonate/bicarbonate transport system substrate-binding protein
MHLIAKSALVAGATALAAASLAPTVAQAQDAEPIHVALADLPEVETLFFLVGLARAGEKGLDYELTFFNGEELAIQAILAGQADVGLGSPYAVIQNAGVPVRLFQQTSRIIFFPVAKAEIESWQDMDGKSMTYHSRGGPLEALASIVAEREGITLGTPNFVPGSENRVVALVQGHVDAAVIDLLNKNMIMEEHPGEFRVLSWVGPDEVVTDEALFARLDWLQENEGQVALLLESLLESARDICANPAMIAEEREKYNLLPDLPQELADGLADYYAEAIEAGVYSCDGGSVEAAETDISVLTQSGQLQGSPEDLKVENFWYFAPLDAAKQKVGM